ncbi:odorant receptor 24a-like isoform X2 [Polyergus mexicanus]|uniref:odorant receptor 24a-like isoform X2 n=1 Tax=Polyergus mexicanus TaxID=615972 RepID=UPI0038B434F9
MNFVGSCYYRIHRIMLTCLGLWPYYTRCSNYVCCIFLSLFFISGIIFQLTVLINKEYSMDTYLKVYSFIGPILLYIIKYFTIFFKSNKAKNLMEQIRYDWDSLKEKEELKIMHKRANIGKRFTFIMIILTYTMIFLCMLTFYWPNILDIVIPLNESRQSWNFPNTMEYFINQKKYIYLLTVYLILIGFIGATILIALDTLAMMCAQHACAMFQITSYRIECIVNRSQMKSLAISKKSDIYKSIAKAIDSHLRGIKFVDSMKSIYETVHLFIIPIGVAVLSINLYYFCEYIMADTRDSNIIITFGFIICHFCYMFLNNYIGQQIIDHSNNVFKKICSTRWYATPLYTQKCLLLMMHRSMKSTTLSIRCVFLPSLEGFATLINASLSYCMVIYSRRHS